MPVHMKCCGCVYVYYKYFLLCTSCGGSSLQDKDQMEFIKQSYNKRRKSQRGETEEKQALLLLPSLKSVYDIFPHDDIMKDNLKKE